MGKFLLNDGTSKVLLNDGASFLLNNAIEGTLSATDAADVFAGAGVVLIQGTLSATDAADVAAFDGAVSGGPELFGTLAATDAADTIDLSGIVVAVAVPPVVEVTPARGGGGGVHFGGRRVERKLEQTIADVFQTEARDAAIATVESAPLPQTPEELAALAHKVASVLRPHVEESAPKLKAHYRRLIADLTEQANAIEAQRQFDALIEEEAIVSMLLN